MHFSAHPGSEVPSRTQTPSESVDSDTHHSLRAQFHSLLPRYAIFHACIEIHQISSVPLVKGDFSVRWKIKHTTGAPAAAPTSVAKSTGLLSAFTRIKDKDAKGKGRPTEAIPSVVVSDQTLDDKLPEISALTLRSTSSSSTQSRVSTPYTHASVSTSSLPSVSDDHSHHSANQPMPCGHLASPERTPHRGATKYLPLQDHAVKWEHKLHTTLKIPVSRETGILEGCSFKLVVNQRVIPGDPDAPRNPRLGAIYLDLSEYAGVAGETTRRYLLRQSKTNATMKLTVRLKHIGGDTHYTAPALPKGEILNGVAGLLDANVYNARPKHLDVFDDFEEKSQVGPTIAASPAPSIHRPSSRSSFSSFEEVDMGGYESCASTSSRPRRMGSNSGCSNSSDHASSKHGPTPDINMLPDMFGPESTHSLIESIFNPTPREVQVESLELREDRLHNPFVYLYANTKSKEDSKPAQETVRAKPARTTPFASPRMMTRDDIDSRSIKSDSLKSQNLSLDSSSSSSGQNYSIRPRKPPRRNTSGRSLYYGDVESVVGITH